MTFSVGIGKSKLSGTTGFDSESISLEEDLYIQGQTCVGMNCKSDVCIWDKKRIREFYCDAGAIKSVITNCPTNVCNNGACVNSTRPPKPTCTDSDGGVYPFVKGSCIDSRGFNFQDRCLREDGSGFVSEGAYVAEAFCLTPEMREYCKRYNGAEYCNNLPNYCYVSPLIPHDNLAWSYFPRDSKYFCPNGCKDGACILLTNTTNPTK